MNDYNDLYLSPPDPADPWEPEITLAEQTDRVISAAMELNAYHRAALLDGLSADPETLKQTPFDTIIRMVRAQDGTGKAAIMDELVHDDDCKAALRSAPFGNTRGCCMDIGDEYRAELRGRKGAA